MASSNVNRRSARLENNAPILLLPVRGLQHIGLFLTKWEIPERWLFSAAASGDVQFLNFLLALNIHPFPGVASRIITKAAQRGCISVIDSVVTQGAPLHSFYYEDASQFGHLDVMKYLYSKGTPIDDRSTCCLLACRGRHWDCLLYGIEHGFELPDDMKWFAFRIAHLHGNCKALSQLDRNSQEFIRMKNRLEQPHDLDDFFPDKILIALLRRMEE